MLSTTTKTTETPTQTRRAPRIIRRSNLKKKGGLSSAAAEANALPAHLRNNTQLHHVISTTLPQDYDFEIPKTIWRIEKAGATAIALQFPEGLLMYASAIGDILSKFAYHFRPPRERDDAGPRAIKSLSILGDVTYGACCIDDLSARALGCDLLVHYGHSCLVPLTRTVIPCMYIFVEIRVDVQHLVDCVKLTFATEEQGRLSEKGEEKDVDAGSHNCPTRIIEALVMGTVQFRSAVVESAQMLNNNNNNNNNNCDNKHVEVASFDRVQFQAIVPQAKPLSPGEVLGCTAPSGLAQLDFQESLSKVRRRQLRKNQDPSVVTTSLDTDAASTVTRERVMIFLADGRFHLEAAMISNPSLRALRYDPYSKKLTEERYDIVQMKRLRREAILSMQTILGIRFPSHRIVAVSGKSGLAKDNNDLIANSVLQHPHPQHTSLGAQSSSTPTSPITVGIILGTLGRQGNPAILLRLRTLLRSRGIRSVIVLLSEILPQKLRIMSTPGRVDGGGVSAWVQIACPRLSIDWGHHFCVPVLSPFEMYVALGEVTDSSLWVAKEEKEEEATERDSMEDGYPMDFYSKSGGPWANYYGSIR